LFGSQARDEAEVDSDIDVMLVLQGVVDPHREIRRLSSFAAALSLKHDVVISCVYMSEEDFYNQQSPLMLNARQEGGLGVTTEQEGLLQKAHLNIRSAKLLQADGDFDTGSRVPTIHRRISPAIQGLAYSMHSAVIAAFGREFARAGVMPLEFHAHFRAASEARNISDCQLASHLTSEETTNISLALSGYSRPPESS
jgi:hypothetical protein